MAQVDPKFVNENSDYGMKKKTLKDGTVLWSGPYLKHPNGEPVWFDGGYTEALYKNIEERERIEQEKNGLNKQWQTKEQEASFKKRLEVAKKNKEKAAIIAQAAEQLK